MIGNGINRAKLGVLAATVIAVATGAAEAQQVVYDAMTANAPRHPNVDPYVSVVNDSAAAGAFEFGDRVILGGIKRKPETFSVELLLDQRFPEDTQTAALDLTLKIYLNDGPQDLPFMAGFAEPGTLVGSVTQSVTLEPWTQQLVSVTNVVTMDIGSLPTLPDSFTWTLHASARTGGDGMIAMMLDKNHPDALGATIGTDLPYGLNHFLARYDIGAGTWGTFGAALGTYTASATFTAIPEPTSAMAMLALGAAGLIRRRAR